MKDRKKCATCKFCLNTHNTSGLKGTCDYMALTGKSRVVQEKENGTYRSNECSFYEERAKKRRRRSGFRLRGSVTA